MDYTIQDILAQAERFVPDAQPVMLELMCASAAAELERALVGTPDRELFIAAAALLAASKLYAIRTDEGVSYFSAGSLSVRRSEQGEASRLRCAAYELLSDYTGDIDFAFVGVDG